jgi:hypothetical protein
MIPYHGWTLDADTYQTVAHNWLDHNNIGESNIFWPITWDYALIQGWELTLRSPNLWHRGQLSSRLRQSNRTGNFTDHRRSDLRHSAGTCASGPRSEKHFELRLQHDPALATYASTNIYYGSGFTNGLARRPVSGQLSAWPHHVRPGTRQKLSLRNTLFP